MVKYMYLLGLLFLLKVCLKRIRLLCSLYLAMSDSFQYAMIMSDHNFSTKNA